MKLAHALRALWPAPLVALVAGALAAAAAHAWIPGFEVATIGSRFTYESGGGILQGIPRLPPMPVLPWALPGPDGAPGHLSWELVRQLAGPAFAIAILGAIESLLSAVIADGMSGDQHDPDAELIGQGLGNLVAPFFGGIAATGAIARTATNFRYGARTPFASVFHALFILAATIALAPALALLPMAGLAALLLVVAWNMGDFGHVRFMLRVAPRSDVLVLLTCFTLTVAFDMVIAVTAGVLLAALLFMREMADASTSELLSESHPDFHPAHASRVVVYEIAGPLFFGAASRFAGTLRRVRKNVQVVVLDLRGVPVMDATGLVSLQSTVDRLGKGGIFVVLAGVRRQPAELLGRAGVGANPDAAVLSEDFDAAIAIANRRLQERAP
jgi:SulP family sulfate permease